MRFLVLLLLMVVVTVGFLFYKDFGSLPIDIFPFNVSSELAKGVGDLNKLATTFHNISYDNMQRRGVPIEQQQRITSNDYFKNFYRQIPLTAQEASLKKALLQFAYGEDLFDLLVLSKKTQDLAGNRDFLERLFVTLQRVEESKAAVMYLYRHLDEFQNLDDQFTIMLLALEHNYSNAQMYREISISIVQSTIPHESGGRVPSNVLENEKMYREQVGVMQIPNKDNLKYLVLTIHKQVLGQVASAGDALAFTIMALTAQRDPVLMKYLVAQFVERYPEKREAILTQLHDRALEIPGYTLTPANDSLDQEGYKNGGDGEMEVDMDNGIEGDFEMEVPHGDAIHAPMIDESDKSITAGANAKSQIPIPENAHERDMTVESVGDE
ncbi:MAG: hypothetical protein HQK52_11910 [Oligoflexia bacterium]|nr:hypothetical protein [Oligoflexia bacterium]